MPNKHNRIDDLPHTVYRARFRTTGKSYVGLSFDYAHRKKRHKKAAFHKTNGKLPQNHFYRAIREYGFADIVWRVLEITPNRATANVAEKKWIKHYDSFRNGYNETPGGDSGFVLSQEAIERNRQSNIGKHKGELNPMYGSARVGELNPMFGKKQSPAAREKIRQKQLAHHARNPDAVRGKNNPMFGTHKTDAEKKNLSEKCRQYRHTPARKKKIAVAVRAHRAANPDFNVGKNNPNYGNKYTPQQLANMRAGFLAGYVRKCQSVGVANPKVDGSAKVCFGCNTEKSASDFKKRSYLRFGLANRCRVCERAYEKRWRAKNKT